MKKPKARPAGCIQFAACMKPKLLLALCGLLCLFLTACGQEMTSAQLVEAPVGTPLYGLEDGAPAEMASGTSTFTSGDLVSQKDGGDTINVWYQNTNDAAVSVLLYQYNSFLDPNAAEQTLTFQVAAGEAAGMSCSGSSVAGKTYLVHIEVCGSGIGDRRSPEISGALLVTQSDQD